MFGLEKYSTIFGEPRQGAHAIRVFDIAIIDLVLTVIVAFIVARMMNWRFLVVLGCLLLLSIVMHRLFGVRTKIDTILFG
jgi:hypothetical protein